MQFQEIENNITFWTSGLASGLIGHRANWNKKGAEWENFRRKLAGSIRKRFKVQIGANWDKAIIIYGRADGKFLPLKIYKMVHTALNIAASCISLLFMVLCRCV